MHTERLRVQLTEHPEGEFVRREDFERLQRAAQAVIDDASASMLACHSSVRDELLQDLAEAAGLQVGA